MDDLTIIFQCVRQILLINKINAHDGVGSGDNKRGDEDNGLYKVNKQKQKVETTNKWWQCEQSGKAHDEKDVKNYMRNNKKEGQMRAKAWMTLVTMEITKTL